jgi:hypothetical protein
VFGRLSFEAWCRPVVTLGCKPPVKTVHLLEAWRETDAVPLGDERGSSAY